MIRCVCSHTFYSVWCVFYIYIFYFILLPVPLFFLFVLPLLSTHICCVWTNSACEFLAQKEQESWQWVYCLPPSLVPTLRTLCCRNYVCRSPWKVGPLSLFSASVCVCVCERNVVLLSTLHMASSESDSLTCFSPFFLFSFGP